jgi:Ser/Thr protein kinase RdoA (MazF antagonist)
MPGLPPEIRPDALRDHLEAQYGDPVSALERLDAGVFRVDRREQPSWVARVFPPARPIEDVHADAALLGALERRGFPAERCAHEEPVSTLDECGVLVTEFVPAAAPLRPGRPAAILGVLLGRLHAEPGAGLREGGAWHHLSFAGGPREEIAAASSMLEETLPRVSVRQLSLYDQLRDEVDGADDCHDLPHAFVHPDFVPANAIPTPDERLVVVDWTGAGRGPRLWSLGFLLFAAGSRSPRLIDLVVSRYRRHVTLEPEELTRLAAAIRARPLMLACWAYCAGRMELETAVLRVSEANAAAARIAEHARRAFESG